MRLGSSTIIAAALLSISIFANAQTQAPKTEHITQAESTSSPAMAGSNEGAAVVTPDENDNMVQPPTDRSKQKDSNQLAPDDPRKSPYWDPKDWNYINSTIGD
jgi:hypothetical protein